MGASFAKVSFDYPEPGPEAGDIVTTYASNSLFYSMAQHASMWPDYYIILDFRSQAKYAKCHIVGATSHTDVDVKNLKEMIVLLYSDSSKDPQIKEFLLSLNSASIRPTKVHVLKNSFRNFSKQYQIILSSTTATIGESPGPYEIIPPTKKNPGVYFIQRRQFQHCKSTIAHLGCTVVINISSKRLFLKTAQIVVENVNFDNVSEPYDIAISAFNDHMKVPTKSRYKGHLLLIDENECFYGSLLCGWWWHEQEHKKLEEICELLTLKFGELDPWYLDVLRAWVAA